MHESLPLTPICKKWVSLGFCTMSQIWSLFSMWIFSSIAFIHTLWDASSYVDSSFMLLSSVIAAFAHLEYSFCYLVDLCSYEISSFSILDQSSSSVLWLYTSLPRTLSNFSRLWLTFIFKKVFISVALNWSFSDCSLILSIILSSISLEIGNDAISFYHHEDASSNFTFFKV